MSNLRFRVNNFFDIVDVLQRAGYNAEYNKRLRCPFHDDKNPDAEPYKDGNLLYCYPESTSYTPYDILVDYMNVSPQVLDKKVPDSVEGNTEYESESFEWLTDIRKQFIKKQVDIDKIIHTIKERFKGIQVGAHND